MYVHNNPSDLRILARSEAKIAKICNFWTLWPVIQLVNHLFKIRQKAFLPNAPYRADAAYVCKKCSDISSDIYVALGNKPFCRILKRRFIS